MSKSFKSNLFFVLFLVIIVLLSIFITYILIINHHPKVNDNLETPKPYYNFTKVSKKDTLDISTKYPITINMEDKISISGLKNKEVETKINNKLANFTDIQNDYGDNTCIVTFNYSNVLSLECQENYITLNLVDGKDITFEEIFQQDSNLLEISKEALYDTYCPWLNCEDNKEYNDYDNYIDNYLISGMNAIKKHQYTIRLYSTSMSLFLDNYNIDDLVMFIIIFMIT